MLLEFLGWLQHQKTRVFGTADTVPALMQHTPASEAVKLSEMKPTNPRITAQNTYRTHLAVILPPVCSCQRRFGCRIPLNLTFFVVSLL